MQHRGVRIDDRRRSLAHRAAVGAVAHAERELEGYGFPVVTVPVRRVMVNSRPALLRALQAHGLLHFFRSRKAASGYAITRDLLKEMRDVHPLLDALYRHRRYARVASDRLFLGDHVGADDNVHCEIDPLGTGTGRPAYKRPNIVGLGAEFRPVVIPDRAGYGLAELDFVAQEVFVAAVVFSDPVLLADVNAGDPYRRMVGWLFTDQLPPGHEHLSDREFADHPVCKPLRKRAKVLTLGIIYGMGDALIAAKLGVSEARARRLRDRFFERYAGLKAGMALAVRRLEERGYAETVTGAKRFRGATGPLSRWEERWAVNTPVQGSAACVLKVLLARLEAPLAALDARVLLAPYDAVLLQHPLDERGARALALVAETMKAVMREFFPGCEPRVDVNDADPSCWNDEGRSDSIENFLAEMEVAT
jgi:DNA polymerase-1